ncbi:MAG TPA: cytochrome d ubiquinol oxidase subunit II [Bacteroidota bacterium]
METLWYWLLAFMLIMYVLLDGFDLGAGIIHLFVARDDRERRTVLSAIGPVWDGYEVWLIAAGGTLFFAFPAVYAASFSGFYLPLIIILWLLMLRGLGIEFRHQIDHPLWRAFWDAVFALGSIFLSIFFGAALGNIIRGVPLNKEGFFFEPLWTTFTVVPEGGILDWFTATLAAVSFSTLTVHGANFLAVKTEGEIQQRARGAARIALTGVVGFSIIAVIGTLTIRPGLWSNFTAFPAGFVLPFLGVLGLAGMVYYNRTRQDGRALISSLLFIAAMLASTAFGLFPALLPASTDPAFGLTAFNAAAKEYALGIGISWWLVGIVLALAYLTYLEITFRGKVKPPEAGEGY